MPCKFMSKLPIDLRLKLNVGKAWFGLCLVADRRCRIVIRVRKLRCVLSLNNLLVRITIVTGHINT